MRVLLLGAGGQLGQELVSLQQSVPFEIIPRARAETDITERGPLERALCESGADVVVNAAAYTKVDVAEDEPDLAFKVNAKAPGLIAEACAGAGIPTIHISTDHVFDGSKRLPYREQDLLNPLNVYGSSKAAGEGAVRAANHRHVIMRTSWIYGSHGKNFLKTILQLANEQPEIRVVSDQVGCPTCSIDVATAILRVIQKMQSDGVIWGTYHFAGRDPASWYDFAKTIISARSRVIGSEPIVVPINTDAFAARARRPAHAVLDSEYFASTFGYDAEPWRNRVETLVTCLVENEKHHHDVR